MGALRRDIQVLARGWRWSHRPLIPRSVAPPPPRVRGFPTAWARSETGRSARDLLQRFALSPLMRIEVDPRVYGVDVLDAVPPPVIFVANHSSHLDAPLILTSLPPAWRERTATGAAADYFFDVWWRAAATALIFNAFPVERAGGRGRATQLARELLEDRWSILMFPEGTRSRDGWTGDFRLGAARLALEADVPVVPIGIRGTYQSMPRGKGWPAKGRQPVHLRFGRPILPNGDDDAASFSDRIKDALALTLEEDRTSWWDAQKRAARGEPISASGPSAARWRRTWEASRPMPQPRRAFRR